MSECDAVPLEALCSIRLRRRRRSGEKVRGNCHGTPPGKPARSRASPGGGATTCRTGHNTFDGCDIQYSTSSRRRDGTRESVRHTESWVRVLRRSLGRSVDRSVGGAFVLCLVLSPRAVGQCRRLAGSAGHGKHLALCTCPLQDTTPLSAMTWIYLTSRGV